jgi:hypothetical protein
MKETAVERRLIKRVKDAGGRCMKILPVERGFPDRLVLLPGGRFFLVELKAPGGKLRPDQRVFIDRAAKMGIKVYVLYSTEQVNEWVDARLAEVST